MVKFVSLNIERDKHLDLILPFLKDSSPDIFCVQELFEQDIVRFNVLFPHHFFVPMARTTRVQRSIGTLGVGIFSRWPIIKSGAHHYAGDGHIRLADGTSAQSKEKTIQYTLALCDIQKGGALYRIGTTHFPWTPDGSASDFQRQALGKLLAILQEQGEMVFCGDFNAPRGGEIFSALAATYKDNVPLEYLTSIDSSLHRAGPLQLMVDGLFSTPAYQVSEVVMVSGLSDHCALVGVVQKI